MKLKTSDNKSSPVDRPQLLQGDDHVERDLPSHQDTFGTKYIEKCGFKGRLNSSCIPISMMILLIILVALLPIRCTQKQQWTFVDMNNSSLFMPQDVCNFSLVETIPEGLIYINGSTPFPTTYDLWRKMIANANHTIEIASFYWTLRNGDVMDYPGSEKGEQILADLIAAGKDRKLTVKIAQSQPTKSFSNKDTEILANEGAAEVRSVNMPKLVGGGVLHTKLWIIDRSSAYIGSANSDWRALSQVKEMGIFISNCSCLVNDIGKIFDVYWKMGTPTASVPEQWPEELSTGFNDKSPMRIVLNHKKASVYISSSPPPFCPDGRENDIDSILKIISRADRFIYIAVMDYMPLMIYTAKPKFWPVIDNALRTAAINQRVEVRLLISYWNHTRAAEKHFLKSLVDISNTYKGVKVLVKLFVVPSTPAQHKIPYARVNHNKYMVTDNVAYIGTSNWSGDYFTNTAGVGVIIEGNTSIRTDLESVFLRDWNSEFAHPLPN